MSNEIPQKMKASVVQESKTVKLEDVPVPSIVDDEVLIKTATVAVNPTDWKGVEYMTTPGAICGCEFAGHIVQVGKDVTTLSVGDLVAGIVHGSKYTDKGAFAEYLKIPAELAWRVPSGVSAEDAATMSVGPLTVVQGFFHPERLAISTYPAQVERDDWMFVYGGSSSVGMFAIQIAKLIGYKVVATASPRNFDLCKGFGADLVFDYKDSELISKIKSATRDTIHIGIDCISTKESQMLSVRAFGSGAGKLLVLLRPAPETVGFRSDITVTFVLLYTALGCAFDIMGHHFPAMPEDRAQIAQWLAKHHSQLIGEGKLKPNPVKLFEGGLEHISDAFEYMKAGKNSGEKLVFRV